MEHEVTDKVFRSIDEITELARESTTLSHIIQELELEHVDIQKRTGVSFAVITTEGPLTRKNFKIELQPDKEALLSFLKQEALRMKRLLVENSEELLEEVKK